MMMLSKGSAAGRLGSSRSSLARRPCSASRQGMRAAWLYPVASSGSSEASPEQEPASSRVFDPETDQFNATHLGSLQRRIEELRLASTMHFLEHGYQQSVVQSAAQDALDERPELPSAPVSWSEHLDTHSEIDRWHEDAWQQVRQAMDGNGN